MDLLKTLRTGTYTAAVLCAVLSLPLTYIIMKDVASNWFGIFVSIISGLVAGCAIGYATEYFTSDSYKPTKNLANAALTGAGTTIIGGISLACSRRPRLLSCPLRYHQLPLSAAAQHNFRRVCSTLRGLGIGLSAVGMLSTLGITLATVAYGPVMTTPAASPE